jgi:hypothetical protein
MVQIVISEAKPRLIGDLRRFRWEPRYRRLKEFRVGKFQPQEDEYSSKPKNEERETNSRRQTVSPEASDAD